MIKRITILLFTGSSAFVFSQPVKFAWPLDSPHVLTANYGELRPNHFHAGLDFSTGGQVNLPVYSAAEGYVSRIKVSSTGYGKCVYITHPNGKVTLYGHMNSYSLKIASIVTKEQFSKQNFEVEVFPKPSTVFVRKGEILGLSGSTGSSTGPHLHFEVRDEKTEAPLNPLEYLRFVDYTRPLIQSIGLYNLADTSLPKFYKAIRVIQNEENILLPEHSLMTVDQSVLGVSFSGFDRFTPVGSTNNIYSVKVYLDGRLVYAHKLSGIRFEDTRYINEYSEAKGGMKYQKCFLPTLYPREFIVKSVNRGRIILSDSNFHSVKVLVSDEFGNLNDVQFHIRTNRINSYKLLPAKSDLFVNCNKDFTVKRDKLYIRIPAGSLYYSTPLIIENAIEAKGKLVVLPADINLRNAVTFGFKIPGSRSKNKYKFVLKNGSSVSPPNVKKDSVFFDVKGFGSFQLSEDTQGPKILSQLRSRKEKQVTGSGLSFIITDALSGIARYKLFLNNQWVLAEYDAKYDLLTYHFDEGSPTGRISLRLEVEDKVGNKTKLECTIRR